MTLRRERCDCENPGPFNTPLPGILALMQDGKVARGAVVERCDLCERYPSDAAAFAELREHGLLQDDVVVREFSVHCYALVRVKFSGVIAPDEASAARQILDRFDWDVHGHRAVFADEITEMLVEPEADGRSVRSTRFTPELEVVEP